MAYTLDPLSLQTTAGACIATGIISAERVIRESLVIFRMRVEDGCSEETEIDRLPAVNCFVRRAFKIEKRVTSMLVMLIKPIITGSMNDPSG